MHRFDIRYRNTQGTLMRILTALTRRGLEMVYVHAEADGPLHQVTLATRVNAKQLAQLCRDWRAIVDVIEVSQPTEWNATAGTPKPPARTNAQSAAASSSEPGLPPHLHRTTVSNDIR